MEERVHPIPFRTRQLSSPSSMILRILTWESRTTPRLYFQRAVLSRTALCFLPEAHPHRGHPQKAPGPAQALPAVSPPPSVLLLPPSFCCLRLYAPVRFIIGVSFSPLPFSRKPYRVCPAEAPENLRVRRRDVLMEMHSSHTVSIKKGQETGRDVLGNSSPAT